MISLIDQNLLTNTQTIFKSVLGFLLPMTSIKTHTKNHYFLQAKNFVRIRRNKYGKQYYKIKAMMLLCFTASLSQPSPSAYLSTKLST